MASPRAQHQSPLQTHSTQQHLPACRWARETKPKPPRVQVPHRGGLDNTTEKRHPVPWLLLVTFNTVLLNITQVLLLIPVGISAQLAACKPTSFQPRCLLISVLRKNYNAGKTVSTWTACIALSLISAFSPLTRNAVESLNSCCQSWCFFVYETGKILHAPGTASLFNNPIYTEIELNKTGTYFFHQNKVEFFPPCFLWKSFSSTNRKKAKNPYAAH